MTKTKKQRKCFICDKTITKAENITNLGLCDNCMVLEREQKT